MKRLMNALGLFLIVCIVFFGIIVLALGILQFWPWSIVALIVVLVFAGCWSLADDGGEPTEPDLPI